MRIWAGGLKRLFDLISAGLALLLFGPILIIIACVILLTMGGPVFFRQERPGKNGTIFRIFKFRTMTNERDKSGELLPDEMRLKGIGKLIRSLSLDELPQLINVVKGDMSLIGPRPLLVEYLPLYSAEQQRRHDVRPGITGWAQINGRNAISWEEKFKLDVWYVEHISFVMDIKILIMTVKKVIKRDGISQEGNVTMEKFNGGN